MQQFKFYLFFLFLLIAHKTNAGPPFQTDDPEPVEFKHWEYYLSSINTKQSNVWSGTLPHAEVNYGVAPNFQIHLIVPLNYISMAGANLQYGYGYTELGLKYRFIKESDKMPQIGTFPILEIPTVPQNTFNNGRIQLLIPLWLQKSWDKLTTYGGGGYWITPGANNKNWFFGGWEIQYDFAKALTLGGELYYHTPVTTDAKSSAGFNIGGFVNFSEKVHFIFSAGHSFLNESTFTSYAGLYITI